MKKLNLQLFAEAVKGDKIVYLFRVLSDAAQNDATALAFTTENGLSISKDADTTVTKDGTIRTPGEMEIELTADALLAKGDTMFARFKEAMKKDEVIEIWEANLAEPVGEGNNKFKGT